MQEVLSYWRAVLQILILAFLIYKTLYYLRGTRASFVLAGVVSLVIALYAISKKLNLEVILLFFDNLVNWIALGLIIIFQPELRRAFAQLGAYVFSQKGQQQEILKELVGAAHNLSMNQHGALIVIEGKIQMQAIIEDAIELDNHVQSIVLESIFFPNSPLHDGAVIIRGNKIVAARAMLPLSRVEHVSKRWGTRHRAAVGITEELDAVVLVVSEETGMISVASGGVLYRNIPLNKLYLILEATVIKHLPEAEINRLMEVK